MQQTRVNQGLEYYLRFINRFPNVESLAQAEEAEVLRYWQGLGYYSRARNMHRAAQMVIDNHLDIFSPRAIDMDPDELYQRLLSLPGVGAYTAGAIASFAFDFPYPALDGNVYRVLARLYDCDIVFDTSRGKKHFHQLAYDLLDCEHPRLYNSAIMEFGALYCTPTSPDCQHCPIQECCLAYAHHTVELLPVRRPRTPLRDRYFNYIIYITEDLHTLIHQRTEDDIWKHLYEFPLIENKQLFASESHFPTLNFTHILSHQRLHARFQIKKVSELPPIPNTITISLSSFDDYALSRLTLRAIEALGLGI